MKCGYCGKNLKTGATFCTNCGHSITDDDKENARDIENSHSAQKNQKLNYLTNSPMWAIIVLVTLIVILTFGGINLIMKGLNRANLSNAEVVSASSTNPTHFDNNSTNSNTSSVQKLSIDSALIGKWLCTDKTAAGYNRSDYGIDTSITLTFNADGSFKVNYCMKNAGITSRNFVFSGTYSVDNGKVKFSTNLSGYDGDYFDDRDTALFVKYSMKDNVLFITDKNGNKIKFIKS